MAAVSTENRSYQTAKFWRTSHNDFRQFDQHTTYMRKVLQVMCGTTSLVGLNFHTIVINDHIDSDKQQSPSITAGES